MNQVSFDMSSDGAAAITVAGELDLRSAAVDGEPALVCVDNSIVGIFEITGLDRVLPLQPTLGDALSHVPVHAAS